MRFKDSKDPCIDCNKTFQIVIQRGRPPIRCDDCRESRRLEAMLQAEPVIINPETLYKGPQSELLGNERHLPQGRQAQCVKCWRIFTTDSAAESHKDYRNDPPCINPVLLGMIAVDYHGIPIWKKPMDAETITRRFRS